MPNSFLNHATDTSSTLLRFARASNPNHVFLSPVHSRCTNFMSILKILFSRIHSFCYRYTKYEIGFICNMDFGPLEPFLFRSYVYATGKFYVSVSRGLER